MVAQQVVAPIDRRTQRLLPFGERRAAPPVSRREPLVEPAQQMLRGESSRMRAAASSIASGSPSEVARQMSDDRRSRSFVAANVRA